MNISKYILLCANQIETLTSPPRHTPGNLDFDVLVRSNSLHIFVFPFKYTTYCEKLEFKYPHPMYELVATAFRNFGNTKLFFPSKTLFDRSKPFSFSQRRTRLIPLHLNSPIDAILDSAHSRTQSPSYARRDEGLWPNP